MMTMSQLASIRTWQTASAMSVAFAREVRGRPRKRANSIASLRGIWRGRRTVPPAPATTPTFTSDSAKRAAGSATAICAASMISSPPPKAKPLTATMSGFFQWRPVIPAKPLSG